MKPGISILCPTRNRPDNLDRMIRSALGNSAGPVQFVFYVDLDDKASQDKLLNWSDKTDIRVIVHERYTHPMSDMWNQCAGWANHEIVMFVDDEAVFHTPGWDTAVYLAFESGPQDLAVLVQPNDTIHGDANAGYFFAHLPTMVRLFGRVTPPHFSYGYADCWPMEVFSAVGRKLYLPEVVIENMAPKDQPPDRIHQENHERAVRDRPGDLYNALQPEREAEVEKLRHHIEHWRI